MNKLLALGYGAVSGLLLLSSTASATQATKRPELEGAWQVVVTLRADADDCTTSPVIGPPNPFLSLNTFHSGGTMSEFGTRSPPSTRTSGHGTWERTGYRSFDYRYVFYSFDPTGVLIATFDWRGEVKLPGAGKTLEGTLRLVRTDTAGNELRLCATLEGERITL